MATPLVLLDAVTTDGPGPEFDVLAGRDISFHTYASGSGGQSFAVLQGSLDGSAWTGLTNAYTNGGIVVHPGSTPIRKVRAFYQHVDSSNPATCVALQSDED